MGSGAGIRIKFIWNPGKEASRRSGPGNGKGPETGVLRKLMAWQAALISPPSQPQISHVMRTGPALTPNGEPEGDGGPSSYPVYLMERQTLGGGQLPSP